MSTEEGNKPFTNPQQETTAPTKTSTSPFTELSHEASGEVSNQSHVTTIAMNQQGSEGDTQGVLGRAFQAIGCAVHSMGVFIEKDVATKTDVQGMKGEQAMTSARVDGHDKKITNHDARIDDNATRLDYQSGDIKQLQEELAGFKRDDARARQEVVSKLEDNVTRLDEDIAENKRVNTAQGNRIQAIEQIIPPPQPPPPYTLSPPAMPPGQPSQAVSSGNTSPTILADDDEWDEDDLL